MFGYLINEHIFPWKSIKTVRTLSHSKFNRNAFKMVWQVDERAGKKLNELNKTDIVCARCDICQLVFRMYGMVM